MLGKCLFKHKRRALFYSYHLCAQESQMNKFRSFTQNSPSGKIYVTHLLTRVFSTSVTTAQHQMMSEVNRRQQG
jgi:hypothetical protein